MLLPVYSGGVQHLGCHPITPPPQIRAKDREGGKKQAFSILKAPSMDRKGPRCFNHVNMSISYELFSSFLTRPAAVRAGKRHVRFNKTYFKTTLASPKGGTHKSSWAAEKVSQGVCFKEDNTSHTSTETHTPILRRQRTYITANHMFGHS